MALQFGELTDAEKLEAANIYQKIEAIDAAKAENQTWFANKEQKFRTKNNELDGLRKQLQIELRAIRQLEEV